MIAVDDSGPSRKALAVGVSLARKYQATAVLCHVVSSMNVYTRAETADYDSDGGTLLKWAEQNANANDVSSEVRLLHGEPLEQLLQTVIDADIDLIVMGTHGRKGLARFYVGSVAEGVLRRTSIPVLVVRAPVADEEDSDAP